MVRAYLFLALFIPLTFFCSLSALLCALVDASGRSFAFHARLWARLALACAGTRVTLTGAERLPPGPVLFMSNHQSGFDILALLAALPRSTSWIAKKELFSIPLFGSAMLRGGFIPLDRRDPRQAMKSLEHAIAMLRAGRSLVIFPEGTRSQDFRLLPFKRGGFKLALRAGVPVAPVTINGSGRVNPAGTLRLYGGTISIVIHPAIPPSTVPGQGKAENELMTRVHHAIASALEL